MSILPADDYKDSWKPTYIYVHQGLNTGSVADVWAFSNVSVGYPTADVSVTIDPANTTTGIVPVSATFASPRIFQFPSGAKGYLASVEMSAINTTSLVTYAGSMKIADVLWAAGHLAYNSGTTTFSSQASYSARVPFKADGTTRDYSHLEIWVGVNASPEFPTGQTVQVNYTNQDGVTGRSTPTLTLTLAAASAGAWQLPLQVGDTGVQKIESVTVSGGTQGSFDVFVLRHLFMAAGDMGKRRKVYGAFMTNLPEIFADTCLLCLSKYPSTQTTPFTMAMSVELAIK